MSPQAVLLVVAAVVAAAALAGGPPPPVVFDGAKDAPCFALVVGGGSLRVVQPCPASGTAGVVAVARYNNTIETLGWEYLHVDATTALRRQSGHRTPKRGGGTIDTGVDDPTLPHYHAGYLEGFLTVQRLNLSAAWVPTPRGRRVLRLAASLRRQSPPRSVHSDAAFAWAARQLNFTVAHAAAPPATHGTAALAAFWGNVNRTLAQLRGFADGGNAALGGLLPIFTLFDIYALNLDMEWNAIEAATRARRSPPRRSTQESSTATADIFRDAPAGAGTHCSSLVRAVVPPAGSAAAPELFASQAVWGPFELMNLRFFKTYALPALRERTTGASSDKPTDSRWAAAQVAEDDVTVVFSSYTGMVSSADDWYQTSRQLAVQETTNGNMNGTLWRRLTPHTVAEFARVLAANAAAADGATWAATFGTLNSGTYCNQWQVVDFKQFAAPGAANVVGNGTLWVLEQLPGLIVAADQSEFLRGQGYWPSYNLPFYKEVYELSGFAALAAEFGDFFSYQHYARAEIFRREAPNVTDAAGMRRVMRWNQYTKDPFSRIQNCSTCANDVCNPAFSAMLAIASRGDLNPLDGCYGPVGGYLRRQPFGALDAKIARWSQRATLTTAAISGPTNDDVPTFVMPPDARIPGRPVTWDFPWTTFVQPPSP